MNIGLVLSGGMAKGAYQIGALRAIKEILPADDIKILSCASVGALNGYAFLADRLDRAEQMWKDICGSEDVRYFIGQILRGNMLQQNITDIFDPEKKLSATFYCTIFDWSHRNLVYRDISTVETSKLLPYLKASVAIPVYNRSVRLDEGACFDGALIDNIPVFPLLKSELDYIICVYFDDVCYEFENADFDKKIIKITFHSESRLKQSLVFSKEGIEKMIREGYERTEHTLNAVFAKGIDDLDYIYAEIANRNRDAKNNRRLRITGDILVTNMNKITQKLTKRDVQ